MTPTNPAFSATFAPPVMEARRWIAGKTFAPDRPLLNLSQAAPVAAPPLELRQELARAALSDGQAHLYGPVLGLPDLRAEVAARWTRTYGGPIASDQIAITAGCNQAFTAVMSTIAGAGDEVILPTPWYFNHKMWCDMNGVRAVPLTTGPDMVPRADDAAALITPRTRAIVLVTPNNPTGAEYPADTLAAFYDLARAHDLALIVDATYLDFDSRTGAPHDLFTRPDWDQTLIQLYSFSKAYRLTGHRVGAMAAAPDRLAQVEKYLDTVTICPNQIAQIGALWGMRNLDDWLSGERAEILSRAATMRAGFERFSGKGWRLMGCGAYFAYVAHPFAMPSSQLAPWLVDNAALLTLPGTMFQPPGTPTAEQQLRLAFANSDHAGLTTLFERLENIALPLAPDCPKP